MRPRPIILLFLMALMLSGCTGKPEETKEPEKPLKPEEAILGIWKATDDKKGTLVATFYGNGMFSFEEGANSLGGTYQFIDNKHIKINYNGIQGFGQWLSKALGGAELGIIEIVSISKDTAILILPNYSPTNDTHKERVEFKREK